MASRRKLQIIFLLVFCLPGLAVLGYALRGAADAHALADTGVSGTGTIIEYERQERRRGVGRRFCPVVEFAHAGASHRFTDGWCNRSQKEFPAGTPVPVVFDAGNPTIARVAGFWPLYGDSLFIAIIGTPWLLLGIALVLRVK